MASDTANATREEEKAGGRGRRAFFLACFLCLFISGADEDEKTDGQTNFVKESQEKTSLRSVLIKDDDYFKIFRKAVISRFRRCNPSPVAR